MSIEKKYRISVCIPTYNRGEYIEELLNSFYIQPLALECQVVISDNASTDNTDIIVSSFIGKYDNIIYIKNKNNIGADLNYLQVVSNSSAEYCWLMGSDDILLPQSLYEINKIIEKNKGITGISVNQLYMSKDLKCIPSVPPLFKTKSKDLTIYKNFEEISIELGFYFGYLSGQIVNRHYWNEIISQGNYKPFLNAYVHVYIILSIIKVKPYWIFDPVQRVGYRSGNDSFLNNDALNRLLIDVNGYSKIYQNFFKANKKTLSKCQSAIIIKYIRGHVIEAKLNNASAGFFLRVFMSTYLLYYKILKYWTHLMPFIILPVKIIKIIKYLYRRFLRKKYTIDNYAENLDIKK